jgi:aconitate hydratase 2/2-methylisocitrate dehydratase
MIGGYNVSALIALLAHGDAAIASQAAAGLNRTLLV